MLESGHEDGLALGVRGDDTPEEKLKYARLQTEGYQDDGYQDSEDNDVS